MTGCGEKGDTVWYSHSDSQNAQISTQLGIDSISKQPTCLYQHAQIQPVSLEALQNKQIKELAMYDEIYPEVKYGEENSRIDFLLKGEGLPDCYVEVKSITFVKGTLGMFPDAVTIRGQKHVRELLAMKKTKTSSGCPLCWIT